MDRNRFHRRARRVLPRGVAALLVTLTACGPEVSLEIGLREEVGDVTYGPPTTAPPPRPPARELTGFPAPFLSPVRRGPGAAPSTTDTTPTTIAPPPCKGPSLNASPREAAAVTDVPAPKPGTYRFRRTGSYRMGDGPEQVLPPTTVRTVSNVETHRPLPGETRSRISYDVTQIDGPFRTTTNYEIVEGTATAVAGIYINHIIVEAGPVMETFVPMPPVRFFMLPAAGTPAVTTDRGVDAVTRTRLEIVHQTTGRVHVDGCKERYDAWNVKLWAGTVDRVTKSFTVVGSYAVATQFGGLVVAEDLTLKGTDEVPFELKSKTVIDSVEPL